MRHTTEITLVNRADEILAERGIIERGEVRRLVVHDALVDTGATMLSLPQSLVSQLGLTPVGTARSFTANGTVERSIYSEVRFTVLGRSGTLEVTELPDDAPVLVGHMVMELLDLAVDMQRGLTYNPAHGGEWTVEQLCTTLQRRRRCAGVRRTTRARPCPSARRARVAPCWSCTLPRGGQAGRWWQDQSSRARLRHAPSESSAYTVGKPATTTSPVALVAADESRCTTRSKPQRVPGRFGNYPALGDHPPEPVLRIPVILFRLQ